MTTLKCHTPFAAMVCLYHANDADELAVALDSAFGSDQTVTPSELIVVYDGPVQTKVTEVVNRLSDKVAVRQIIFDVNKGHGPARAAAIDACSYPWIAIIDADDISMPHRFATLLDHIEAHPNCAVVGGALQEFYEDNAGQRILGAVRQYPQTPQDVAAYTRTRSPVAQPTAMLRIAAIRAVGNYQSWFNNEDYHLWIRLLSAGYSIYNINDSILLFRTSPALYGRRGGLRYWWNEVSLQWFSLHHGTTTFLHFVAGFCLRLIVQVLLPNRLRSAFYKRILRRS